MSWARYWATRARAPPKRRAATPFAARSWLTRLNSTPAAPPTAETGGATGRGGAGGTGFGRAATGAGAAAGGGAGGASSTSLARSFTPEWRARGEGTSVEVAPPGTTEGGRRGPPLA